jgi:ferrous iron transport protein B
LERNLNLVLQVLEITDRVVICLNLMDEAHRHGLQVDERRLARDLGVPVVPTVARKKQGLKQLIQSIDEVATGQTVCRPHRLKDVSNEVTKAVRHLEKLIMDVYPSLPNARWVALRLLDGDPRIAQAIDNDEFGEFSIKDQGDSALSLELGMAS